MGKYPVISISLKGADAANYDEAYRLMVQIINDEAECFQFLLDSEKHYGQKVVVLIDEYDVPLAKAYENNFMIKWFFYFVIYLAMY